MADSKEAKAASESFNQGYHDIPDKEVLQKMSYTELCIELRSCQPGTPRYDVIEREQKKHLAIDQAKINRTNIIIGASIGGACGIAGVVIGVFLRCLISST